MRLTDKTAARLTLQGKSERIVFDDELPGFGLRLRAGGTRTWIAQYQFGQKQRRITLGRAGVLPEPRARLEAKTVFAKAHLGDDPQAAKFKKRAEAAVTLGVVAERFLERQRARLRPRSLPEVERYLLVHWKPLHALQLSAISRADVAQHLGTLAKDRSRIVADMARTRAVGDVHLGREGRAGRGQPRRSDKPSP